MHLKAALFFAAALPFLALPARADVPSAVAAALNDRYKLTCAAVLSGAEKDLDAAFAVMAPDFVETSVQGKAMNRDQVIANAKQQMKTFHGTSCDNSIDSATQPDANTIVATVSQNIDGQIQGPDANHNLSVKSKTMDTWKLTSGVWMETSSKDLRTVVKIDGKVVQDEGR